MVTKTKPKLPAAIQDLKVQQISISDKDLSELAECCGIDCLDKRYKSKLDSLRIEINQVLTNSAHYLKLNTLTPSPANITAHLEQILSSSNQLSELIKSDAMAKQVLSVLPDLDSLRNLLELLSDDASTAITSLGNAQSRGSHNQSLSERKTFVKHDLLTVFSNQTIRDYTGDKTGELDDRNEFEKICKKYITAYTPPQY